MTRVNPLLQLNEDVEKLGIYRKSGQLVFFATREEIRIWPQDEAGLSIEDLELATILDSRFDHAERVRIDGRTLYRVIITGEAGGGWREGLLLRLGERVKGVARTAGGEPGDNQIADLFARLG